MKSALLWILCFTYEITFIFSDLSSITSCSDPRWKLKTNDGLWNSPVNIWTIRNVSIVPSQNTHFVNVNTNIPMNSLGEVQNSIKNCGGIHDHRIGKPVFLNCPCEYDEVLGKGIQADKSNLCPGSLSLRGSGLTAQLPVVRRSRDLLLIFNTWGGSPYHVIVESILPAWITVQILIRQLNFPVNSMTLLNLGAFCPSNKHSEIRPLIEALFGNGTYEDSTGTQSGSFSDTAPTHYELLVYGFHHSLSPLSGNRRKVDFNDEIGKFVLEFSQTLKANLLSINELSGGSIFRDTDKSRESSLNNAVLSSKISPVPIAANISAFDVNTSKTWWHDKKSFPRIAFTKRTRRDDRYIESLEDIIQTFSAAGLNVSLVEFGGLELPTYNAQAAYTAGVDVLVGAEGGPVLVSDCGLRLQTNMRPLQSNSFRNELPMNYYTLSRMWLFESFYIVFYMLCFKIPQLHTESCCTVRTYCH